MLVVVSDVFRCRDILAELEDGRATFEALAAKHSTCPSGKRSRGDLGKFGKGQMVKEFDEVAFDPACVTVPVLSWFTNAGLTAVELALK